MFIEKCSYIRMPLFCEYLQPAIQWRLSAFVTNQQGILHRCLCTEGEPPTDGEQKLSAILKEKFPKATFLAVHDISGIYVFIA